MTVATHAFQAQACWRQATACNASWVVCNVCRCLATARLVSRSLCRTSASSRPDSRSACRMPTHAMCQQCSDAWIVRCCWMWTHLDRSWRPSSRLRRARTVRTHCFQAGRDHARRIVQESLCNTYCSSPSSNTHWAQRRSHLLMYERWWAFKVRTMPVTARSLDTCDARCWKCSNCSVKCWW